MFVKGIFRNNCPCCPLRNAPANSARKSLRAPGICRAAHMPIQWPQPKMASVDDIPSWERVAPTLAVSFGRLQEEKWLKAWPGGDGAEPGDVEAVLDALLATNAVSYTHLTLPTILLV